MLRVLRGFVMLIGAVASVPVSAHDLERTQVSIRFARDGSFTLEVSNDPKWLQLRLERFNGGFADRVVLWVDGREVRPVSDEFIQSDAVATHRLRGRVPRDARALRWYYGLVVDPYPLTIQRADGRVVVEEVAGDAWSDTIDLSGQFKMPLLSERAAFFLVVGLFLVPLTMRVAFPRRRQRTQATLRDNRSV